MIQKSLTRASAIAPAVTVLLVVGCSGGSDDATPAPDADSGPGRIEGTVTGPGGEPVAGIRVTIISGTASYPVVGSRGGSGKPLPGAGGVSPPGTFEVAATGSRCTRSSRSWLKTVVAMVSRSS